MTFVTALGRSPQFNRVLLHNEAVSGFALIEFLLLMDTAVPVSPTVRKIMRWVEWIILIQCVIDNLTEIPPDAGWWHLWRAIVFVGVVGAMSLRLPTQATLRRRRLYVAAQMALMVVGQLAQVEQASLFELFIIKACLLLPIREVIVITAVTLGVLATRFVWILPAAIEEVRSRGIDYYLNPQTIMIETFTELITVSVFVVMLGFIFASEQRSRHRAEVLAQEVEALATTLERTRIARHMHDSLGHALTTLDVQLALAQRYTDTIQRDVGHGNPFSGNLGSSPSNSNDADSPPGNQGEKLRQVLKTAQQLTLQCLTEVRQSLQTMRESNFDLEVALRTLGEHMRQSFVLNLQVQLPPLPQRLSYQLYLIAKEGLINVQKHAGATQITLSLVVQEDEILLTLVDNGRGFDVGLHQSGYGLRGIRERSQLLGGQFVIESSAQHGTQLRVIVPLMAQLSSINGGNHD